MKPSKQRPVADARGSDQSHQRKGVIGPERATGYRKRCTKPAVAFRLIAAWSIIATTMAQFGIPPPPPKPDSAKPASAAPAQPQPAAQSAPSPRPVIASYKDLKYPPLHPIEIPKVETVTLSNGMRLYLLENHELPLVNATTRVRTGNLFDSPDKIGLATVTGMVMRTGGTKDKTGEQLDEQLENIAASVETNIGETVGTVSLSALKEDTDEVLAAFKDVMTSPEFRQDKIDLAKAQIRSSISRRNDDAHGVVQREFIDIVYGKDTPYGWREEYATIDRISRADLIGFYQRYFFPKNIQLAVWGDFDAAEMKDKIEKLFSSWNVDQPPVPPFPKVRETPTPGIYLAVKKDVTETFFELGHLGGEFRDPDYAALEIMADILGGGFQSRLVQRVRTKMGNAYDVSALWGANYDHPGLFEINGSTKSLSTVETIMAIQEEVNRIRSAEVSEAELETAKQTALNSLVFAFDTKAKTLSRMLTYEYYGYPKDFIQQYQKALAAVTRADVLRVAKARVHPERFTNVTVGNPQDFGRPLDGLGSAPNEIDLTIREPELEATKVGQASLEKGKQLLERAQQAVGGGDKLAAVKDAIQIAEFQLDVTAGGMRVRETDRWIAPTLFRQESEIPTGKIAAYTDGRMGWISTPQGSGALAGAQLKQVQGDLFRFYFRLLLSDRISERTVIAVDDNTIEISDATGEIARLLLDSKTALPRAVQYRSVHVAGPPVEVEDAYSDFREVAGVKVPHKITITQAGRKFADVTVTDYKVNSGLKADDLGKRP